MKRYTTLRRTYAWLGFLVIMSALMPLALYGLAKLITFDYCRLWYGTACLPANVTDK